MTGVSGLLGRYLVLGRDPDTEIHGISRHSWPQDRLGTCQMHEVDVTSTRALTSVLDAIQPDVIVHAAAEGRVDAVEGNADAYRPLNVEVSRDLAQYSAAAGIQYVFISSNAVFGGAPTPYSDDSPFDPVNDYGRLKAEAEVAVSSVNGDALIVRPILMYGWPYPEHRLNPVVAWVKALRAGNPISVVDDVWTQPLAAWDCAAAIWSGIRSRTRGSVNVSGGVRMTLHDLAVVTSESFDLDRSLISAISSDSLPDMAPRPVDTAFDLARLRWDLAIDPVGPVDGLALLRASEPQFESGGQ